jgi:hypothetical protein
LALLLLLLLLQLLVSFSQLLMPDAVAWHAGH